MVRLVLALVLGLGLGSVAVEVVTGDHRFTWVWTVALAVILLGMSLLLVVRVRRAMATVSPADVQAARQDGRVSAALIESIRRTGAMINHAPMCEIGLVVDARDRAPYRTTIRQLVDPVMMPRRQPGQVVTVVRPHAEAPEVVIIDDPEPPAPFRNAVTAAPEWTLESGALVPGRRRPLLGTGRVGRPVRVAAYVVLVVVGASVMVWPARDELSLHIRSWTADDDLVSFTSAQDRAREAVDALVEEIGGSTVVKVVIYSEWVTATAPSGPGASGYDDYHYRRGRASSHGATLIQPDEPVADSFDVAEVQWSAIADLYRRSIEESAIPEHELNGHTQLVRVQRILVKDKSGERPVHIWVQLTGDYGSATLEADANGTVLSVTTDR